MRKTRAVLIGTNGYTFLMRYWFEVFTSRWQDEIDMVYMAVSDPEHKSVWQYTKALLTSHPKIRVVETNARWPVSVNTVATGITEDLLWIAHDDTFLLKPGVLDKYFNFIEANPNTVVTPLTPIFTPKDTVEELMRHRYPNQTPFVVEDTGEIGYSWYCNMFFVTRDLFKKTSMDFGEWHANVGEYEPLLDWTPLASPWGSDTNFKLTLELLKAGATVKGIRRNEIAHLYNEPDPKQALQTMVKDKAGAFSDEADYVHLQSMAYHIYALYYDLGVREALEKVRGGKVERFIDNHAHEFENKAFTWNLIIRLAWIREFMRLGNYDGMRRYYDHTNAELDYIMSRGKLNKKIINIFSNAFHKLIWKQ